jgi:DNA-binding transcriptional LysR family regulator
MMRTGVAPVWRLRHSSKAKEMIIPLAPRLLSDDMIGLKQAAIASLDVVALPGYVCRDEVRSGTLRRVLPSWLAGDSTSRLSFPIGRACSHRSGSSWITRQQSYRKPF